MGVLVRVAVGVKVDVSVGEGVTVHVGEGVIGVGELAARLLAAVTSMDTLRRTVRELVA